VFAVFCIALGRGGVKSNAAFSCANAFARSTVSLRDQSHMARDLRELGGVTATGLQGSEPIALMSPSALL
jgi:hypothetical protein